MDLGAKYVSFEEELDFVIEEATEDLQDGYALVSYMKISTGTITHKDGAA